MKQESSFTFQVILDCISPNQCFSELISKDGARIKLPKVKQESSTFQVILDCISPNHCFSIGGAGSKKVSEVISKDANITANL